MVQGKLINPRLVLNNNVKYTFDNTLLIMENDYILHRSELKFPYSMSDSTVQEIVLGIVQNFVTENLEPDTDIDTNLPWDWFSDL